MCMNKYNLIDQTEREREKRERWYTSCTEGSSIPLWTDAFKTSIQIFTGTSISTRQLHAFIKICKNKYHLIKNFI